MGKSRPDEIYVLLEKVSSGTFLNKEEYSKLENYISELEGLVENEYD